MTALVLAMIRFYQRAISPALGPACRFEPTCSHYAAEAIGRHGLRRGAWLAARRLARCRPGGARGYDPVPPPSVPADDRADRRSHRGRVV